MTVPESKQTGHRLFYDVSKRVAHDLKAPVRQIAQIGTMLRQEKADALDPDAIAMIDLMVERSQYLNDYIDSIRAYSDAITRPLALARVSLQSLVETTIFEHADTISVLCHGALPVVNCDSQLAGRLLHNLFSLAYLISSPLTRPALSLESAPKGDGGWRIAITYDTCEVDFSHISAIFDPYSYKPRNAQIPNHGFELAECKAICDRFSWSISLGTSDQNITLLVLEL